ncbi:p24 complex component [Mitosporidium daphniae]
MISCGSLLLAIFLLLFGLFDVFVSANYITKCDSYNKQCFFHDLKEGDIFGVNFELYGPNSKGTVNFEIYDGTLQNRLFNADDLKFGTYHFRAAQTGRHFYCFIAKSSIVDVKFSPLGTHATPASNKPPKESLSDSFQQLVVGLKAIQAEQSYLLDREKAHHDTAKSTNSRVFAWTILQLLILGALCYWQIHYVRSCFDSKRTAAGFSH